MSLQGWESLSFEDRQKVWVGHHREFRQHNGRGDRPSVWEIWVDQSRVYTKHGLLEGAMQETNYVGKAKNVGRANAITAEQDALAEARRDARKKYDFEGYDEYLVGTNIDRRNENKSIPHILTNLPGSFCLYKPENNLYDQKKLLAKAMRGDVLYTLKRDGMAKWIVVDYYGNVRIYSRRARLWNDKEGPKEQPDGTLDGSFVEWAARFPHLVEAVKQLQLPPGSMLAGELVISRPDKSDDFRYISTITKSLTPLALLTQEQSGFAQFYWWDIPFFGGEDLVSTKKAIDRFNLIHQICGAAGETSRTWLLPIVLQKFDSPEIAAETARVNSFEGFVVVDPEAIYGDKAWNLKGKPDRPSSCAKLKPRSEDDFIAYWDPDNGKGEWGTGKHEAGKRVTLPDGSQETHGGVGALALYQYNSNGELIYISKVSSGMDYSFQAKLRKEHFPFVCQCEFLERTYVSDGEKTNSLRHPVFVRVREDKTPEECNNDCL